jgi:hypothetical protein
MIERIHCSICFKGEEKYNRNEDIFINHYNKYVKLFEYLNIYPVSFDEINHFLILMVRVGEKQTLEVPALSSTLS